MSLIFTLLREALDADRIAAGDTQRKLNLILERQIHMSKQLDDLAAQVAASDDAMTSASVLIQGLHDQLVAAGTDADKLETLKSDLAGNASKLAAAVAANTAPAIDPTLVAAPVAAVPAPAVPAVPVAPDVPGAAPAVPVAPTQPATTVAAPEAPVPAAPVTSTTPTV